MTKGHYHPLERFDNNITSIRCDLVYIHTYIYKCTNKIKHEIKEMFSVLFLTCFIHTLSLVLSQCPAGTYRSFFGCAGCDVGTFNPTAGSNKCTYCTPGYFNFLTGFFRHCLSI